MRFARVTSPRLLRKELATLEVIEPDNFCQGNALFPSQPLQFGSGFEAVDIAEA